MKFSNSVLLETPLFTLKNLAWVCVSARETIPTDTVGASATATSGANVDSKTVDVPAITTSSIGDEWMTDQKLGLGNILQLDGEETIFFEVKHDKRFNASL